MITVAKELFFGLLSSELAWHAAKTRDILNHRRATLKLGGANRDKNPNEDKAFPRKDGADRALSLWTSYYLMLLSRQIIYIIPTGADGGPKDTQTTLDRLVNLVEIYCVDHQYGSQNVGLNRRNGGRRDFLRLLTSTNE